MGETHTFSLYREDCQKGAYQGYAPFLLLIENFINTDSKFLCKRKPPDRSKAAFDERLMVSGCLPFRILSTSLPRFLLKSPSGNFEQRVPLEIVSVVPVEEDDLVGITCLVPTEIVVDSFE